MASAKIIAVCGALVLSATAASAQTYDDEGFGWGPYYNNHLSQYDGRPIGPPLASLPPGTEYYNGAPRRGFVATPGPAYGPERSYIYPGQTYYYGGPVVRPRHVVRSHRSVKRRVAEHRR
jgi:hypothetical protein